MATLPVVQEPVNLFSRPFADQGLKTIPPDDNAGTDGRASLTQGFPPITQAKPEAGGLPPQRADFNGIYYMLSAFAYWLQSGGQWQYKATLRYAPNCMVIYNGISYMCIKENGVDTAAGVVIPGTEGSTVYWQEYLVWLGSLSADQIKDLVNSAVDDAKKTLVSSQTVCGKNTLNFTAAAAANSIAVMATADWGQAPDGGWSSYANVTVQVNGNTVGTLNMSTSVTKSGSKGHYWGYPTSNSDANTFKYSIKQGDIINITTAYGNRFSKCSIQATLSN